MKQKYFKYIFMTMFAICISFMGLNKLYATSFCDTVNKMYCEYKFSQVTLIYTIDSSEELKVQKRIDKGAENYVTIVEDLSNEQFKDSNGKYKCISKINYTVTGGGMNVTYSILKKNQKNNTLYENYAELNDSCNTFTENYESKEIACGVYGGMDVYSKKTSTGFEYRGVNGTYIVDSFTKKNVSSIDGCPESICFSCSSGHCYATNSSCYKKGEDVKNADDIEDEQDKRTPLFDDWGDIPAVLNGLSKIGNLELTCDSESLQSLFGFIQKIFTFIKIGAFLLLIVLTAMDFLKSVSTSDDDSLKKATKKFITRAVITVGIIILPSLINLILGIAYISGGTCGIA